MLSCSDDKVRQAITLGLATLVGGAAGSLLGTDATSAALGAQNEEGGFTIVYLFHYGCRPNFFV
ncbi:hypothetical protein [Cupriavidus basilensis]